MADTFFGQNGTIYFGSGSSKTPIGVVKSFKATLNFETNDLYAMGSILRQGEARYNASVDVSLEACSFDSTLMGIMAKIFNPAAESGTTSASLTDGTADTTDLAVFTITGEFASGDDTMEIKVEGIYFSNFPWEASVGEWITSSIEGKGKTITITKTPIRS